MWRRTRCVLRDYPPPGAGVAVWPTAPRRLDARPPTRHSPRASEHARVAPAARPNEHGCAPLRGQAGCAGRSVLDTSRTVEGACGRCPLAASARETDRPRGSRGPTERADGCSGSIGRDARSTRTVCARQYAYVASRMWLCLWGDWPGDVIARPEDSAEIHISAYARFNLRDYNLRPYPVPTRAEKRTLPTYGK